MGPTILLIASLVVGGGARASGEPRRPDLLLLSIDTLRPDRLGAYGNPTVRTPAIDALAAGGRRFTQATTGFPRTTPAIASLLTGLWPQHHGSRELLQPIGAVPTLAEILAREGYETVGLSSTAVLSREQRLDRGFAAFRSERLHAGKMTELALEELARASPSRPLFLWIHYFDPHFPYISGPAGSEPAERQDCRRLDREFEARSLSYVEVHGDVGGRATKALPSCEAAYHAAIEFTDQQIGRLLAGWGARRARANTIVVFVADHGEHFGEGGLYYDHGPSLHDAGLRIPLIVAGPGVEDGVDTRLSSIEDVAPTILKLVGVPPGRRPRMDGASLLERRAGGDGVFAESGAAFDPRLTRFVASGRGEGVHCLNDDRHSLCKSERSGTLLFDHVADPLFRTNVLGAKPEVAARLERAWSVWPPETARERSIRTARFKLVEYPRLEGGYREALYDLRHDPAEERDVARMFPGVAERLRRRLAGFTSDIPRPIQPPERTEEELERLRSLGYVQ